MTVLAMTESEAKKWRPVFERVFDHILEECESSGLNARQLAAVFGALNHLRAEHKWSIEAYFEKLEMYFNAATRAEKD